ncbi:MAG: response regulator transcription factor [Deltaproteobacteria bacterium]|nr:response regulator transcription factor [Deltaproteobacteria bacterium]
MACKKILVVEDDPDIRSMISLALEIEGYDVVGAANGKEGLERLSGLSGPCLILLDLMMPVMNGWEFLKAKRESDALAVIPVLVVSAFGDRAQSTDIQGVMKKPIDLESLLGFVKRYCG